MKAIRIILLVLIVIGILLLCTQKFWVPKLVDKIILREKPEPAISLPQIIVNGQVDCTGLCIPFDFKKYFESEESLKKVYIDPVTKNSVEFKMLTDKIHQARNPTFDVYVNGKVAGEMGGQLLSQTSFSPNHKHFAFRMTSTMGASHQDTSLYVVSLSEPIVMFLNIRPVVDKNITHLIEKDDSFIESYVWSNDNKIIAIAYPIGEGDKSGHYYRIGLKNIWAFDLTNPQSVMRNGVIGKVTSE
jgi:hypothetical protein